MGVVPPLEGNPHYDAWVFANSRLQTAAEKLERLSRVPEGDLQLMAAQAEWHAAKRVYDAVCAKLD